MQFLICMLAILVILGLVRYAWACAASQLPHGHFRDTSWPGSTHSRPGTKTNCPLHTNTLAGLMEYLMYVKMLWRSGMGTAFSALEMKLPNTGPTNSALQTYKEGNGQPSQSHWKWSANCDIWPLKYMYLCSPRTIIQTVFSSDRSKCPSSHKRSEILGEVQFVETMGGQA